MGRQSAEPYHAAFTKPCRTSNRGHAAIRMRLCAATWASAAPTAPHQFRSQSKAGERGDRPQADEDEDSRLLTRTRARARTLRVALTWRVSVGIPCAALRTPSDHRVPRDGRRWRAERLLPRSAISARAAGPLRDTGLAGRCRSARSLTATQRPSRPTGRVTPAPAGSPQRPMRANWRMDTRGSLHHALLVSASPSSPARCRPGG